MSKEKKDWEFYGEKDPYFAVSTFDKFRSENLTETAKNEFFQTGEQHFEHVWKEIEEHFETNFRPAKALDFGCGVGRLVIPLATRCKEVVGIDIAEKMLAEARANSEARKLENVAFYQTDDFFSKDTGKYDFIHSFIVFQHINPEIGEKIVEKLVKKLENGGIGALHFTYYNSTSDFNWFKLRLYRDYPIINRLKNLAKGVKNEPLIPMYLYDLNNILAILQKNGCNRCQIKFSDHGFYGAIVFFQKKEEISY